MLVQGTRKIPVQFAKRVVGNRQFGGVRQYIPLKVNAAGVMPIIFAQALMFLPMTFSGFGGAQIQIQPVIFLCGCILLLLHLTQCLDFEYNFIYFWMVVAFTYFYTYGNCKLFSNGR